MLFHSSEINFNIIVLVFLVLHTRVDVIVAHECYVCGRDINLSCDNFNPKDPNFIKECPINYKACSIQTYAGDVIERSCEEKWLQDCKTANNIEYCFCSQSLCNEVKLKNLPPPFSDDEDLAEGSGTSVIIHTQKEQKDTTEMKSHSNKVRSSLINGLLLIATLLYN